MTCFFCILYLIKSYVSVVKQIFLLPVLELLICVWREMSICRAVSTNVDRRPWECVKDCWVHWKVSEAKRSEVTFWNSKLSTWLVQQTHSGYTYCDTGYYVLLLPVPCSPGSCGIGLIHFVARWCKNTRKQGFSFICFTVVYEYISSFLAWLFRFCVF